MTAAKAGKGDNLNGHTVGKGPCRAKPSERRDDLPGIWVGYGKLVKMFRTRALMSREQLAERVGYSVDQVASVEQGRRPAKIAFTTAAEEVLNAMGTLAILQDDVDLAKLPMFFQDFAQIEMEALSRFSFDPLLVPGLLQTEGYARAMFAGHVPQLNEDQVEQSVEGRLARQRLLSREPVVNLSFVIGEAALRSVVGDEEVMAEQLRYLLRVSQLRKAEIQVMPVHARFHPGLEGPFVVLETLENRRYAYLESQGVGHVVSEPSTVGRLTLRYGTLRSMALNIDESARLIGKLIGDR
ncbi:helix-turn-helix transcriptional regulator [Yinghuangia sp. ASG 101]|uniref:helix-turn-helix domain-containing protein n=1 Tax=Yinghuangia sp. ASG 101 TaxID=2896848 RepID=UPI001E42BB4C|nr:helix-turn-helix transcriptional regulator [Yinghuangia sp. ASG 101]UGQ12800.1 helix-turn-helix transcriptional regulator [Yinghuangia sp. ASG 101]